MGYVWDSPELHELHDVKSRQILGKEKIGSSLDYCYPFAIVVGEVHKML